MSVVRVAFSTDSNYAMPLAAAIRSLIENATDPANLEVAVVTNNVDEEKMRLLQSSVARTRAKVLFIEESLQQFDGFPAREYFTEVVYARLLYPALLPQGWNRVISLDADMIFRGDLTALFETDLEGAPLAAAREPYSPVVSWHRGVNGWRQLGLRPDTPYFNAGMMVMDLDLWRQEGIAQKAIEYGSVYRGILQQQEQECLNAILAGNWKEVSQIWNLGPYWRRPERRVGEYASAWDEGIIRHFVGIHKPWMLHCMDMEDAEQFYQYLDMTAWAGWRPTAIGNQ